MAMQVSGTKGGPMAEINVTPMADIMIVLLIIFMVITPMLSKGVDVKLPTAAKTAERKEEAKSITVAIKNDAYRTTYLGTSRLDNPKELVPKIKEKLEALPEGEKMVYLKADRELPYEDVMRIMDLCREAGVEEIALIAETRVKG